MWDWWNNRFHVREIKNTFGMFNQYHFGDKGNPDENRVEKLFADLECNMGIILSKVESSLESDRDITGTTATLQLLESEVHTVYKFIGLAGFRNGPFGQSHNPGDAFSTEDSPEDSPGGCREDWVKTLHFLLENSHKDLAEMDELLQAEIFRPTLTRYKQLSMMKLLFWTTSVGEEFLLSNFLTGLEGYQFSEQEMSSRKGGMPAHVFLPMGPNVLLVLCSDFLCKQSMLFDAPHGITASNDRPAKGKLGKTEGPKRYRPVVPNWKTIYPITPISSSHLYTINNLILALGSVIVYKSRPALEKTIDNLELFEQQYSAWRTPLSGIREKVKNEEQTIISEFSYVLVQILQKINKICIQYCKEEMREEVLHQSEVVEKLLYYTLDLDTPPHLLPVLCRSGAYYMGTRKPRSENNSK